MIKRRPTRVVKAGDLLIGGGNLISVQTMCATRTQDIAATVSLIKDLQEHGADLIRLAVDSKGDVAALKAIRNQVDARLVVDLQENYRLVKDIAPFVEKVRYNPGHLFHHEKEKPVFDKVQFIVEHCANNNCALRIGVNFGSLDPAHKELEEDPKEVALRSAGEHVGFMETIGFQNFVVSLKSSDPNGVLAINRRFSDLHPEVPLHLGVTEAGMLPMGEVKTRAAFEPLLSQGIGDTVRVSLTLPNENKFKEIEVGRQIIADVEAGRLTVKGEYHQEGMNIISCPSCARVENSAFVELAEKVREATAFAAGEDITIAVMGCRVNGPGETDHADLGLWCAPRHVNFKRGTELIGAFSYEEIIPRLLQELNSIIEQRKQA